MQTNSEQLAKHYLSELVQMRKRVEKIAMFAAAASIAAFVCFSYLMGAWSTARAACRVVDMVASTRDLTPDPPKWVSHQDVEKAANACADGGYFG